MRALLLQDDAGIDNLHIAEQPAAEPGPGQIAVTMKAASLNYRDLATITAPMIKGRLPLIPLSDGCGVVSGIGEGVTRVKVGDRVAPMFFQGWLGGEPTGHALATALGGALDGVAREHMVLSQEGVSKVPEYLTDEEAACLPCAGLTAWRALVVEGRIKPGDVVLAQGTGGVSIFALQFAKAAGATVIITSPPTPSWSAPAPSGPTTPSTIAQSPTGRRPPAGSPAAGGSTMWSRSAAPALSSSRSRPSAWAATSASSACSAAR